MTIVAAYGVRVDWVNATLPSRELEALLHMFSMWEGTFAEIESGMHGYAKCLRSASGVTLAWSEKRPEMLVSIPGGAQCLSPAFGDFAFIVRELHLRGARFSRLDLAFDDHAGLIDLAEVEASAGRGEVVRFRRQTIVKETSGGEPCGCSIYFGTRGKSGGGRYAVFYDKAAEQGCEAGVHWVRYECRFQRLHAAVVGRTLGAMEAEDDRLAKARAILAGSVDFVDRAGAHGHLDRAPRVAWWSRVVDALGGCDTFSANRARASIEAFAEWFTGSIAPALSVVRSLIQSHGRDFELVLMGLLDEAEENVKWDAEAHRISGCDPARLFADFLRGRTRGDDPPKD